MKLPASVDVGTVEPAGAGDGVDGGFAVVLKDGAGAAGGAGVCAVDGAGVEGAFALDDALAGAAFGYTCIRVFPPAVASSKLYATFEYMQTMKPFSSML